MKKRLIFFGTPDFAQAHLQALLQSDIYDVVAVVSQPDRPAGRKMKLQPSPVKALALENGLQVFTPESLKKSPEFLEELKALQPDVCVVVAFGQIFPRNYLEAFPGKVVNVHGSLLPRWRGAAPIQRAIMAGDTKTGVSLQVMVPALDAGAIIGEREMNISSDLSAIELHELMKSVGTDLLLKDLPRYLEGKIDPKPQDESLVTYAHKLDKAEANIDWSLSAEQIYNNFRGLSLGPGVKTSLQGKALKIKSMQLGNAASDKAGQVIAVGKVNFEVACAEGSIIINAVQPESKSAMPVSEFLKGYSLNKGDILGS